MQTNRPNSAISLAVAFIGVLALPLVGCTSTAVSQSSGEYVDDTVISTSLRGELLNDADLNVFKIDVETFKGVVQLSGFVDNSSAKSRAERVARGVKGVSSVKNNLIVK